MNTHDSYALASDWAKVCEAADVDTDATAEEVIEGLRKRTKLSGYWRCAMTADIRTAAQREAEMRVPQPSARSFALAEDAAISRRWFSEGAVWAAARVTPTREALAD